MASGLGLAFISVAPAFSPPRQVPLRSLGLGCLTIPSLWICGRPPRYFLSIHRQALFHSKPPLLAFDPVHSHPTACSSLPPPSPLTPPYSPPFPLSLPRGSNTVLILSYYHDATTIKLPDPSTAQGGLSGIHSQPRRPATHDFVLGYRNFISSRLARRCQSRQQFRGIWLHHHPPQQQI